MTRPLPPVRVVAIGGGTGLSTLLRGLKEFPAEITAIVAVTDDGGSSGRLRSELGIPAVGDIRNCLVALAEAEPIMSELFQHRFRRGSLAGHSFGNLLIAALHEILGDFGAAVRESSRILAVRGTVLPSTEEDVVLCGELEDGRQVRGEHEVTREGPRLRRLWIEPASRPPREAVEAVLSADLVALGPGSLFTSILPNLLVPELAEAVRSSGAWRVLVVNVMTQPGETDGFDAVDHLRAVRQTAGDVVDAVLVNSGRPDPAALERYRAQGAELVGYDLRALAAEGVRPRVADVIQRGDWIRHDPWKLGGWLVREAARARRRRPSREA
ncbi:MAG: uridine diphosphate-N-acetylglucosamine-binding protein YvcK [Bacillota bacterium]|nr:uridine diphosphate-N-acetylglucosamine-binding protein YvcK [Bacillota bacterium]